MLALLLFGEDLNLVSIIGIVLLIGIVKKNAIMMIDFAIQGQNASGRAKPTRRCHLSKPVHVALSAYPLTTMAAILGALPLALGTGMGHELRRPLGIAIVGGLVLSQLLTLYTTRLGHLSSLTACACVLGENRPIQPSRAAASALQAT